MDVGYTTLRKNSTAVRLISFCKKRTFPGSSSGVRAAGNFPGFFPNRRGLDIFLFLEDVFIRCPVQRFSGPATLFYMQQCGPEMVSRVSGNAVNINQCYYLVSAFWIDETHRCHAYRQTHRIEL